jgi:hypothetical protein
MGFNMTPKEKAKELWNKFFYAQVTEGDFTLDGEIAYKCALIAIDEIINCTKNGLGVTVYSKEYWEEVKKEIEEL